MTCGWSGPRRSGCWDELLYDVETMLADNLIHGDLSDFNVLLWAGEPFVIDLPQALDPRVNLRSELLLRRDIERLCQWGRRFGVERDADSFATELWIRWLEGEL
jgi:RIO kinase 1